MAKTNCQNKNKNMISLYMVYKRLIWVQKHKVLSIKEWKNMFHWRDNTKKAGLVKPISGTIDLKLKSYKGQRRILIKVSYQQKYIFITNIYETNNRPSKYMHQKWKKKLKKVTQ